MFLSHALHQLLRRIGFDYARFNIATSNAARLQRLLRTYAVDLVLDVGANQGQFGRELRDLGYRGRIVSFEPLAVAYAALKQRAQADGKWETFPYALGAEPRTTTLHIAGNQESSSMLEILPTHVRLAPSSRSVGEQQVEVRALDELFDTLRQDARNVLLKLDTQG